MAGLASRIAQKVKQKATPQDSFRQGLQGLLTAQAAGGQVTPLERPQVVTNVAAPYGSPQQRFPQPASRQNPLLYSFGRPAWLRQGQPQTNAFASRPMGVNALMGLFRRGA